jgi:hypothetical protein
MTVRKSWKWLVALGAVFVPASVLAVSVPNSFTAGTPILAAEMNANFAALETAVTALEASVAAVETAKLDAPATGAYQLSATGMMSYAWVTCSSTACSISGYAYSSTGTLPTATRTGVGDYTVNWTGTPLSGGGHVQVTSYGASPAVFCKVGSWGTNVVYVDCYDTNGARADTNFNIMIIN